jgi:quercetin dioxygenase-like cupin family protein
MPEPEIVQAPMSNRAIGTVNNDFVIQENQARAGPPGVPYREVPLHLHRTEDEAWYVLQGILRFQNGAREFDAGEGSD